MQGSVFSVQGSGFRVHSGLRIQGYGDLGVQDSGGLSFGFGLRGLEFGRLRFGVMGLG